MQVKKFEAKTMKDALTLIKQELGPEAIILSAKDNKKTFGLAGRGSIEVTAAISEKSLQNKKFTETKLSENSKEKFRANSAKHQRALIESTVKKYQERRDRAAALVDFEENKSNNLHIHPAALALKTRTKRRYIDIQEEDSFGGEADINGRSVEDVLAEFAREGSFVLEDGANQAKPMVGPQGPVSFAGQTNQTNQSNHARLAGLANKADSPSDVEVFSLRQEVDSLRTLLGQFQTGAGLQPVTRHPGAEFGLPFEFAAIFEKLQSAGIETRYVAEILEKANKELTPGEQKKKSLLDAWVARYILSHTAAVGGWLGTPDNHHPLHLFVGPAGHGKTSSLVKLASHLVMTEKKKVAIFSADTMKIGAADQLKIYSQILGVPFETIKHTVEFPKLLARYNSYDALLVDLPGFSLKDIQEIDQMRALMPAQELAKQTHLVLSCAMKEIDAAEVCQRYMITAFTDVLVTKLDESYNHGFLYNIQRKTEKPLYSFGIGPKVPEDIELATRERVLDLIYKITKNHMNERGA